MCKHGTVREVEQSRLPGVDYRDKNHPILIDECIADIVLALNDGGVHTIGSCCGHGKCAGSIILKDGRTLAVLPEGYTGLVMMPKKGGE
jgi:hypothetical protein